METWGLFLGMMVMYTEGVEGMFSLGSLITLRVTLLDSPEAGCDKLIGHPSVGHGPIVSRLTHPEFSFPLSKSVSGRSML